MRVICTKRGNNVSISENTEYTVISQTEKRYSLINDKGVEKNYCKSLFREIVDDIQRVGRVERRPQPVAAPVVPPPPVIRDITELDTEVSVIYDDDNEEYDIILKTRVLNEGITYNYETSVSLNENSTDISCGIFQLSGINTVLSTITEFKNRVLRDLNQIPNTNNTITEDDFKCGDLLEAILNEIVEISEDGLLLLSTNITNNGVITDEYIEILDRVSSATVETRNPNSGNRIKLWTLQVTE